MCTNNSKWIVPCLPAILSGQWVFLSFSDFPDSWAVVKNGKVPGSNFGIQHHYETPGELWVRIRNYAVINNIGREKLSPRPGFPIRDQLVGGHFRQNDQKVQENYKSNIFGAKQWCDMGGQADFSGSGRVPSVPPIGETLSQRSKIVGQPKSSRNKFLKSCHVKKLFWINSQNF